jgi:hypothetical protein
MTTNINPKNKRKLAIGSGFKMLESRINGIGKRTNI